MYGGEISLAEYLGFIDGAPVEQPSDGGRLCQRKEGALQKSLDNLRRQLTAKESELTEAGKLQVVSK